MPYLIGLVGEAGVGKDTFASIAEDLYDCETIAYADPMKQAVCRLFGFDEIEQYDQLKRSSLTYGDREISGRDLCVTIGMAYRDADPDYFKRIVEKRVLLNALNGKTTIVTDVRFADEVDHIRNLGGIIVGVIREGFANHPDNVDFTEKLAASVSSDVAPIADLVVKNPGTTIVDFAREIKQLFEEIELLERRFHIKQLFEEIELLERRFHKVV